MALRFVVRAAIGNERLAERRACVEIVAVLGDRLAQLADRLVEVTSPPPRDPEAAVRLGEDRAITGCVGHRARKRCDRRLVARERDQREPVTDQRRRIAGSQLERAVERGDGTLRIARHGPRFTEHDQRLAVVGLGDEQRFEDLGRRLGVALPQQPLRLIELIAVFVEDQLAGEISQPALHARPQRHEGSLQHAPPSRSRPGGPGVVDLSSARWRRRDRVSGVRWGRCLFVSFRMDEAT